MEDTVYEEVVGILRGLGYEVVDFDWTGLYKWDTIYIRINLKTGEPEDCYIVPGTVRFQEDVWDIEYNVNKMGEDFRYLYAEWERIKKIKELEEKYETCKQDC